MILVFGKVNAGKSSFCNFVAERFAANGEAVQYFHLADNAIVERDEPLPKVRQKPPRRSRASAWGKS